MADSGELSQLKELIEVFPDKFSPTDEGVKAANALARTNYEALDNEILPDLNRRIQNGSLVLIDHVCLKLCQILHEFLFSDILSINGQFRKKEHPNNGAVFFGGQKRQELRPRFRGSAPNQIEDDLKEAFKYLRKNNEEKSLENALHFYQKFVFTHPFYDGNGRIARLFVNMYLYRFGLYINWKNLQDKGSFLKKLNYYHETNIEEHFGWWVQVCQKEVFEISEEDEESE